MNLGKMLDENTPGKGVDKTASLQDLRWLDDGLVKPGHPSFTPTGEVGKKDNNIKPALEIEWGYGGIAPLFTDTSAGVVTRNLPCDAMGDAGPVILFARDQMNRGVMGKELVSSLRKRFTAKDLHAAKEGLREQFKLEGIVGCIAVDGRGYKNCKAALASAQHSPYKRFIRHVIGCSCGTPHMLPDSNEGSRVASSSGNAVDDFMASDNKHKASMVAHCCSTMLPLLTARGDLDPSEMDQTMIDMMNVTSLPETVASEIRKSKASNLKKVQAAFRKLVAIRDRKEAATYKGKVNTSEFVIDTEDRPVDVLDAKKAAEVNVDLVNHKADRPVEVAKAAKTNFDGIRSLKSEETPIDIAKKADKPVLAIDRRVADIEMDMDGFVPQDVELGQFLELEFEGTDEIPVDAPPALFDNLEVNMTPDMVV
jgi:hypothetical protein